LDTQRAIEIINSLGVIEVLYQGNPVWIEQVNGDRIGIQMMENNRRIEVPVEDLSEK